MLPCCCSSVRGASLRLPLLPAGEKCLLAPSARYQDALSAPPSSFHCNEPPGTVLSVYDKDINNTVL